jgi:hypothetical protein
MIKLPFVFYEKDVDMNLSFVWEACRDSSFIAGFKIVFFTGQNLNPKNAFILERMEYIT